MRKIFSQEEPKKSQPTPQENAKKRVKKFVKKQKYLSYISQGYSLEDAARSVGIEIRPGMHKRDILKIIDKEFEEDIYKTSKTTPTARTPTASTLPEKKEI